MAELSTIKIHPKVYVGFQGRRSQDEVPLGFMTPYGEDSAGLKRQLTVDNWAKGYGKEKAFKSVVLENAPMMGFKIGRAIRRYGHFSGNSAKVRVEDPRGFELEISIENLVMCMAGTMLLDGELQQECVWGRDGANNVLLPTNSEPYKASLETAVKRASVISLKDVRIGDEITLLDGTQGIYWGSLHTVTFENGNDGESTFVVSITKRYVLEVPFKEGVTELHAYASLKVSGLVSKNNLGKITAAEVEAKLHEKVAKHKSEFKNMLANSYKKIVALIATPKFEHELEHLARDLDDIKANPSNYCRNHWYFNQQMFARNRDNQIALVDSGEIARGLPVTYMTPPTGNNRFGYGPGVKATTDGVKGNMVTINKWGKVSYVMGESGSYYSSRQHKELVIDKANITELFQLKHHLTSEQGLKYEVMGS